MEGLLQDITIYHKEGSSWVRYNVPDVSLRNTATRNRDTTGIDNVNSATIRIFDVDGYKDTYNVAKGDVIVALSVEDEIETAPLTELKPKYGEDDVYQVTSVDKYIFEDRNVKELNHIKLGAI